MTHGDLEPEESIIKTDIPSILYKHKEVRVVICPTGECVIFAHVEMAFAYNDLKTWAIHIDPKMLDG